MPLPKPKEEKNQSAQFDAISIIGRANYEKLEKARLTVISTDELTMLMSECLIYKRQCEKIKALSDAGKVQIDFDSL